jgi:uncharacterized protein (DUF2267 family)
VKSGAGQPSKQEKSLFVASVALSYAVRENYVEEVAIEVTMVLARDVDEGAVPDAVRDWIMKSSPTAWDLAVHPGWRALWVEQVRKRAKGDTRSEHDFGMLTANARNVGGLFERVGVNPLTGVDASAIENLDKLVQERGEIVHTGKAPANFRKKNATDWRAFVEELGTKVDAAIAIDAKQLTGKSPW